MKKLLHKIIIEIGIYTWVNTNVLEGHISRELISDIKKLKNA